LQEVGIGLRTKLATHLGVDRSGLYRTQQAGKRDEELKVRIQAVLVDHPLYGHRRVALALEIGHNRARRVMRLFGLGPKQRKPTFRYPAVGIRPAPPNLILELGLVAGHPSHVWACDFTYLWCMGRWYYLATVIDQFTRELVGWSLGTKHDTDLILGASYDALSQYDPPQYLHFDRGSEYVSERHLDFCQSMEITVSASHKASPWENGFQERWNGTLKSELGSLKGVVDEGELLERVAGAICYYNHDRIHTKLKTSPRKFRLAHEQITAMQPGNEGVSDKVMQFSGA
jgi:putative transposase